MIKSMDELRELMGDREYVTRDEVCEWTGKTVQQIGSACGGCDDDFTAIAKLLCERPFIYSQDLVWVHHTVVIHILMRCSPAFLDDAWKALVQSPVREQLEAKAADEFGEEIAAQLAGFKP